MLPRFCLVSETQNVFSFAVPDGGAGDGGDGDGGDGDGGDNIITSHLHMRAPLATGSKRKRPFPMFVSLTSYRTCGWLSWYLW